MYNNIQFKKNLDENKKLILSLKYKILTKYTSLFADIELSDKISNEMKLQILNAPPNLSSSNKINNNAKKNSLNSILNQINIRRGALRRDDEDDDDDDDDDLDDAGEPKKEENIKEKKKLEDKPCDNNKENIIKNDEMNILSNKSDIMKMINTQDFIKGFWEENDYTKIIKEKYITQYNSLKNLKDININDQVAITILVILFISNEHKELLNELYLVIKKAKIFINKETNCSYEDIIKKM